MQNNINPFWDSDDLIKRAIVASNMPVPYPFRCKFSLGQFERSFAKCSKSCNSNNTYFDKDWLLPYSQRMKGYAWNTTYRREENCGQKIWFIMFILFVIAVIMGKL